MPVEVPNQEKFPSRKIKPFECNSIALVLQEKTQGHRSLQNHTLLKYRMAEVLNVTEKKVTRLLNNTDQPTIAELAVIAQVLDVKVDELIQLAA